MSDKQFSRGDVVRLKSGGPRMTVGEHWSDGLWSVQWFDGRQVRNDRFYADELRACRWWFL